MVVAIPLAPWVERDQEVIGALELVEHRPRVVRSGDRVTQPGAEPLEHAGAQKEPQYDIRLLVEHLARQVVGDSAIVSRESGYQLIRIRAVAQRQRRQVQPRGPALGAQMQSTHCGGRESELMNLVEQVLSFSLGEAELFGIDLAEISADSQPRERQRRL